MTVRLLAVAACMAVSVLGITFVRRRFGHERLEANNGFASLAYGIIGAVYGVYLAFTVVVAWEQFGEAERNATSEAVYLSQVWRNLEVLPAAERDPVQDLLLAYGDSAIKEEWPSMAASAGAHAHTAQVYEDVWRKLYDARPGVVTAGDAAFFNSAVGQMSQFGMSRRLRLLSAEASLPSIMWILLVGGGILTVGLTGLIGTRDAVVQISITAAVTGLVVFSLLIVAALQHPFVGDVSVQPTALVGVVDSMRQRQSQRGAPKPEPTAGQKK